jgi:acetyltransferase-like isoleucine patch superfamily enzyme
MADRIRRAAVYGRKWVHYNSNALPWNRLAIHRAFASREAFVRWPVEGNILQALRNGWLTIGRGVTLEPHVWISILGGRLSIGDYTRLTFGVFVSVVDSVDIGAHCGFGNGSFISDGNHRFDEPDRPWQWQGMVSKGPLRIEDNVWVGANVAIMGGLTIGERCVIGANSVVTSDLPPRTVCGGVPAKVIRKIEDEADLPVPWVRETRV